MSSKNKHNKLDVLTKRRRQVASLDERKNKMLRPSTSKHNEEIGVQQEKSFKETKINEHNKSRDESDLITSSTVSFPRGHAYFVSPQKENKSASYSSGKKIHIISDIKIKGSDIPSNSDTKRTLLPLIINNIEKQSTVLEISTTLPNAITCPISNTLPDASPSMLKDVPAASDLVTIPVDAMTDRNTRRPSDASPSKLEDVCAASELLTNPLNVVTYRNTSTPSDASLTKLEDVPAASELLTNPLNVVTYQNTSTPSDASLTKLEDVPAASELLTNPLNVVTYQNTSTPSDASPSKLEDVFAASNISTKPLDAFNCSDSNMPPDTLLSTITYPETIKTPEGSPSILDDVLTVPEILKIPSNANAYAKSNISPDAAPSKLEDIFAASNILTTSLDAFNCSDSNMPPDTLPSTITCPETIKITKSDTDTFLKMKRKRMCASSKKMYIDFLSDDDQDFSAGSSDLWSCDESDYSNNDLRKKRLKKLKKIKKPVDETISTEKKKQRRNKRKVQKKFKNEGKSYENRQGKIVEEKKMQSNPCMAGKCLHKCFKIPEEKRLALFNHFYNLDIQRRRDWLLRCCRSIPIKRKRTSSDESRRSVTHEYFINYGEDHRAVCQKFLLATLDVTQKFLRYTMQNAINNMAKEDMRKPNVPEKYTQEAKNYVHTYIKKLPVMPSHYSRKRSSKMYLPQEFKNVSNIYRKYLEDCELNKQETVSISIFRNIFNEYNLGIHVPKKDKCVLCTKAENNTELNVDEDKKIMKEHLEEKSAMYKRFEFHQNLRSSTNDTITTSFDLQKVLNTPHGESMLLYYARKYSVYNFTLYESTTQNVFCYTWGESEGHRGSNEIATCLLKYLQNVDIRAIKNLILYCDSCGGQNKNKTVLATLHYFLTVSLNLETIQINFLLPGHTYMPVDSVHAIIEREVKRLIVWSPSQWATYFESARKKPAPYKVNVLDHSDFIDLGDIANQTFTKTTLKNIQIKNLKIATFKKKNTGIVQIKNSMKKDAEELSVKLFQQTKKSKVKGKGKGKGKGKVKGNITPNQYAKNDVNNVRQPDDFEMPNFTLKPLYTARLPISAAKYKDLIRLCDTVIPKTYHTEYRNLPSDANVHDILPETDEEDGEENTDDETLNIND